MPKDSEGEKQRADVVHNAVQVMRIDLCGSAPKFWHRRGFSSRENWSGWGAIPVFELVPSDRRVGVEAAFFAHGQLPFHGQIRSPGGRQVIEDEAKVTFMAGWKFGQGDDDFTTPV